MKNALLFLSLVSGFGTQAQFVQMGADSLKTTVPIRFSNIGEGAGKVLTSDVKGIATWQNLPTGYWQQSGAGGNEIRSTNTGGFWSAYPSALPYNANNSTNPPISPTSGNGTRMTWIPARSAFQAATFNAADGSVRFVSDNIGLFSFCTGLNVEARSRGGVAFGVDAIADGTSNTIAFGENVRSNGQNTTVFGYNSWANANNSILGGFGSNIQDGTSNTILFGEASTSSANRSFGFGRGLNLNTFGTTYMGSYNSPIVGNSTSWVSTDPLLVIGNGQDDLSRSNALVMQKNGVMSIGITPTASTTYRLRVGGSISASATVQASNVQATNLSGSGIRDVCTDANGNLIPCTAVSSSYNISAMGFQPVIANGTASSVFTRDVLKCLIYFTNGTKDAEAHAYAPVELPHGAEINKLYFNYLQNAGDKMILEFYKIPKQLNGNGTVEMSVNSSSGAGVLQSSTGPASSLIIDNDNFYYYLKLSTSSAWQGSAMALRGVIISYSKL